MNRNAFPKPFGAARDTKHDGHGPALVFTPAQWAAFTGNAKLS